MNKEVEFINVNKIKYDTDNPKIKKALEKVGGDLNPEKIHFALQAAKNDNQAASYERLRDSIRASNGIVVPIIVVKDASGFVCIDGNTRLSIYQHFLKEGVRGDWSVIKATILDHPSQKEIETIRVAAHLVGARAWPAYEKARYLHYLRNTKFLEYAEIIAICGGNKTQIERQIAAYEDMNEFYRNRVDDAAFRIDRFSGFVELQRPNIKKSIFDAGLDLKDFGEWIRDGKIYRLATVRNLPTVLKDDEARKIFLNGGSQSIEEALKFLDQNKSTSERDAKVPLDEASIGQISNVLTARIRELPFYKIQDYKSRFDERVVNELVALENLADELQVLLRYVSE